ncbi:MAG: hypothetical protein H6Q61_1141 [Firmicutes bacterium]|nr:hypothetical protein [Bacillota bacterium]
MRYLTEPVQERQYDLRYVSRLTPEEIRRRLAEKTVPFKPHKANSNPLLLQHKENGDFYLISSGYHHYIETFGIAHMHLEPRPGSGDTVIYGEWKEKMQEKQRMRDLVIVFLLLFAFALLHPLLSLDIYDTGRNALLSAAVSIVIALIVRSTAPKYRIEEKAKLQAFIEANLLD